MLRFEAIALAIVLVTLATITSSTCWWTVVIGGFVHGYVRRAIVVTSILFGTIAKLTATTTIIVVPISSVSLVIVLLHGVILGVSI